jgi:hypothetical protein
MRGQKYGPIRPLPSRATIPSLLKPLPLPTTKEKVIMAITIEKSSAHIRIDAGVLEQLRAEAKHENRSLSNYIESIFYRIGYKPSSTQQVITPELQARIDKAREEIRSGNCTVIRSQEALNDYLDNL